MSIARMRVSPGGVAGVAGVVVPTVGLVIVPIWTFPPTSATGAQVGRFAVDHRPGLQAMMVFYTVGVALWGVLGCAVWTRLRERLPAGSAIPTCFAYGLVGFVTLLLAGFATFDVLVYRGTADARVLYDLTFGLLAMSGMPTAICLGAFAIGVYRCGMLPRPVAHLATVAAAAHVLLLVSFVAGSGFFSLEGPVITVIPALLWAWVLASGLALLRSDTASG